MKNGHTGTGFTFGWTSCWPCKLLRHSACADSWTFLWQAVPDETLTKVALVLEIMMVLLFPGKTILEKPRENEVSVGCFIIS